MNLVALIHRQYKENKEVPSAGDTGRVLWTLWNNPTGEADCPPKYGWDYEPLVAGEARDLDNAVYLATLSIGGDFAYSIKAVWYIPEHRDEVEIPDEYMTSAELEATIRATHEGVVDEEEKARILAELLADIWDDINPEMYFVRDPDSGDWDLYSVSGKVPKTVYMKVVCEQSGSSTVQEFSLPISWPSNPDADPKFEISPPTFPYPSQATSDCITVGYLVFDSDVVANVIDARYDGECSGDDCLFEMALDEYGSYYLNTRFVESELEHVEFNVPIYIKYLNAVSGLEIEVRKEFTIYGRSTVFMAEPYVKYIRNLATRVGKTELVTILGGNFTQDMNVRLSYGSEWYNVVPHEELIFGKEDNWDTISFMMNSGLAMTTTGGEEPCAVYDIQVGYGDGAGFLGLAGTGDSKMVLENNVGLIRFKYNADTQAEQKKAAAGAAITTNTPCFYATEIEMVYDSTDARGNETQNGGASGKYGKTIYWKVNPEIDCEKVRYVKVKLKYNKRLDYRKGNMVLDGVNLTDGDVVWLAGQTDGTDGLWVVSSDEWEGLRNYIDPEEYSGKTGDPCIDPAPIPLPVDDAVFIDLGARVNDSVDQRCAEDVPEKYGTQVVCGYTTKPGDLLILSNQSDMRDGLWEVTCADWIYRGPINDSGTTDFDASDAILYQNNINFCACRDSLRNPIYNIEYYYLNAGCYLATAVRKVKMICARYGGIVPNNQVVITDYAITVGAEKELVVDSNLTAGDGQAEDCTKSNDNFEQKNGDNTAEVTRGCGEGGVYLQAPDCKNICDCPRYYLLDSTFDNTKINNGFSMVFWQFGDGGWHLYAYIQQKGGGAAVSYYVYHLHVCGIALPGMVDENTDVYVVDDNGLPTSKRTKDAWFVPHGGVLADGFGMYDEGWKFVVPVLDESGKPVYDEFGNRVTEISHELNADTLFQSWSLHAPTTGSNVATKMLAHAAKIGEGEVAEGISHSYGFKFYHTPLTKERFCQIYNSGLGGCVCQDTWTGLVTDQCYDSEGYPVDCRELASEGPAFLTTDNGEPIVVEKACFDSSGTKIDCD
jgi:hypothetical protein